jgi:P27 family predicted phage terminase small subunit
MAGRKIIPIELKKLRGTYRKDRDRKPPASSKGKPTAPAWLNTRAKRKFGIIVRRLDDLTMASSSYTECIALLASRLEETERHTATLEAEGYLLDEKIHPVAKLRELAMNHSHKLLVEFGLTASAIQRVGAVKKEAKKKNPFER